jgi:hypothetical protein
VSVAVTLPLDAVMCAIRAAAVFAATVYPSVPFPEPELPDVIVTHVASLTAVHPAEAVIAAVRDSPPDTMVCVVGSMLIVLTTGTASWLTVTLAVAVPLVAVRRPVRAAPVLAATAYVTGPFPVPDAPDDTVIQVASAVMVHADVAVTDDENAPPAAGTACVLGVSATVSEGVVGFEPQDTSAAATHRTASRWTNDRMAYPPTSGAPFDTCRFPLGPWPRIDSCREDR